MYMPRINVVVPDWVQSAVAFSIKCPNATIPPIMHAGVGPVRQIEGADDGPIPPHLLEG